MRPGRRWHPPKTYGRQLLVAGPDDLVGSVHAPRKWLGDLEHDRRRAGDLNETSETLGSAVNSSHVHERASSTAPWIETSTPPAACAASDPQTGRKPRS